MATKANEIRDAVLATIASLGTLKTARVVPTFQWQPEDMPACSVYRVRCSRRAIGDVGTGEPSFQDSIVIGVSLWTRAKDEIELDAVTDIYVAQIEAVILSRPDLLNLFEGVESMDWATNYPTNASAYIAETRLEFAFQETSIWAPYVPDDFRGADFTERPAPAGEPTPPVTFRTTVTP
ncbi:hypothetical protein [Methylobacterium mesophilicum]